MPSNWKTTFCQAILVGSILVTNSTLGQETASVRATAQNATVIVAPEPNSASTTSELVVDPKANTTQEVSTMAGTFAETSSAIDASLFEPSRDEGMVYFGIDWISFRRSGPSSDVPLVLTEDPPVVSFSADQIDLGSDTIPLIRVGIGSPYSTAMELEYWSADHFSHTIQSGTDVTPIFFNAIPSEPVDSYSHEISSEIDSLELNFWDRKHPRWRTGAGLRYIAYREIFDVIFVDPNPPSSGGVPSRDGFFSRTENRMFGAQIAADLTLASQKYSRLVASGKLGGFVNWADIDALALNHEVFPDETVISLAGSVGVIGELSLTRRCVLRLGYTATVLDRVAQSIDNSEALTIFDSVNPGDIDYSTVLFHGFLAGLQFAW